MEKLKEQEVYVNVGEGARGKDSPMLEPRTGYFHSKEQLIELANRIWEAGYKKGNDDCYSMDRDSWGDPNIPDQTTFINSLFEKE